MLDQRTFEPFTDPITVFENMPEDHEPMFCIYNGKFNKFIGYSIGEENSLVHLCTLKPNMLIEKVKIMRIEKLQKWAGLEYSTCSDYLIISSSILDPQTEKEYVSLKCFEVSDNKRLNISASLELDEENHGISNVQFFRKIKGSDIFLLACESSIAIVHFEKRNIP